MDEKSRILEELRGSFEGPLWLGPPVREILRDVDAKLASARPIPGRHSIWEILLHVTIWEDAVRQRTRGEPAWVTTAEQDWPPVGASDEAAWREVVDELERVHAALVDAAAALRPEDLDRTAPGQTYTIGYMLHGVVQHTLYHLGQIALLKRAATVQL
ncbi:MAG: DinB family protein [Candidatus Palauibacterales bacterium]|nr:DinB family protein [Candidatus Palauibacterales bacterium]